MGILTDRVGQGLDALSTKFQARLKGWAAGVIGFGIEVFADVMAKSAARTLKPLLDKIDAEAPLPPEFQALFAEIRNPTGEFAAALATRAGNAAVSGALSKVVDYLLRPVTLALSFRPNYVLMDIDNAIALYLRHEIEYPELLSICHQQGVNDEFVTRLIRLKQLRFPSDLVFPLYLRDKDKYAKFIDDLRQLGIDEERIQALLELTYKIPGVQDVIRYAVKEAYSPEIYKAFGQDAEFPTEALPDAERAGVREDHLLKEWIAHWELPGVTQGYDMFHRGLITLDQLKLLMKARDIMPFWRDKLIGLSWDLPNRIELRMMARYGLVDKPFLMRVLEKVGVDPEYRESIADLNLAVGLITDLRLRYANGYITADTIKGELAASGLASPVQERIYQYIVKVEKPARVAAEKDLTKAEIIKGVKLGVISWEEGIEQLVAMGYDQEEAMYILAINLEVAAGSPHNVGDFKRLTELSRLAQGLPTERTAEEIATSEAAVAAKFPVRGKLSDEEVRTRVDTTRRKRRRRELTRDEEVTELLKIGLDISLATAYAENDDLRLQKGVGE